MSAHTPSPWYASTLRTHSAYAAFNGCDIGSQSGANVAAAFYDPRDQTRGEAIANARLIASAPDLLDALQTLLDAAEGDRVTQGDCYQARAAIAKAKGKQ